MGHFNCLYHWMTKPSKVISGYEKLLLPPATKLGQGNVFTGVCDSVNSGVSASVHAGIPHTPQSRHPPRADTPPLQAHSQGGNWGGSDPGPHPSGKLRGIRSRPTPKGEIEGIRSRPTPKGEIEGDQIQAHTQGGNWGGSEPDPPPTTTTAAGRTHPTGMHSCIPRSCTAFKLYLDSCN